MQVLQYAVRTTAGTERNLYFVHLALHGVQFFLEVHTAFADDADGIADSLHLT